MFDTFEGLLSTYSSKYKEKFNNELFSKLNKIAKDEDADDEEGDDD